MSAIASPPLPPLAAEAKQPEQICFSYSGTNLLGKPVVDYLYADDEQQARSILTHAQLSDVEVWPRKASVLARFKRKKVTRTDIGVFAMQLAQRTKAKQPIRYAVGEMAKISTHPVLRPALYDVRDALKNDAESVGNAFRRRPDAFTDSFCKILGVGAETGDPTDLLLKYGESQIKTAENISRIISATIYPGVILSVAFVIVFILCYWVMPQMEDMYKGLLETTQAQLPLLTRILLGFSRNITSAYGVVTIIGSVFGGASLYRWAKSEQGSEALERSMLRWPAIGPVLRTFNAAYTVHLLAILSDIMIPTEFLKEAADASVNIVYRETLQGIREAIIKGRLKVRDAFQPYSWLFGDDFQPALATAEETGSLTQLHDHAKLLDYEVEKAISRLSKLVEPLTIVIAGTIIALIVLAAYWPLFSLVGQMAAKK